MKQSFIFYKSFYDAIKVLGKNARLELYDNIMELNFNHCENLEEIEYYCEEIESNLKQNRLVYGTFMSIKPQLIANMKKYYNGQKGASAGVLGGAPFGNQNAKNNPKTTPNVNEKENEKENENVPFSKKEKYDPFFNPTKTFFAREYEKVFGSHPYLSYNDAMRLMELKREYKNINEIIPQAIEKLKRINFKELNFTPSASWLLKGNNFERVMNGEFEPKKTEMELLKEELGID